ncbi:MAG TPA: hypothetical protein VGV13_22535 [Methylomirabilota bacterium]|jgi:hypothetical protein|nr:hypothetical protein [Methylomirabilota bacterium]
MTTSTTCARCEKTLTESDRIEASGRLYCRACYQTLRYQLQQAVGTLSKDVNYPLAVIGAVLGGVVGTLIWWGFTVLTNIAFGLVAVAIGFLVGHGAMRFAGGKRTTGLQVLAILVATISFFAATYLVNMTFINQELVKRGEAWRIPFPPSNLQVFYRVVAAGFGLMDVVFLAIVVWQAWAIPRPLRLPETPAA